MYRSLTFIVFLALDVMLCWSSIEKTNSLYLYGDKCLQHGLVINNFGFCKLNQMPEKGTKFLTEQSYTKTAFYWNGTFAKPPCGIKSSTEEFGETELKQILYFELVCLQVQTDGNRKIIGKHYRPFYKSSKGFYRQIPVSNLMLWRQDASFDCLHQPLPNLPFTFKDNYGESVTVNEYLTCQSKEKAVDFADLTLLQGQSQKLFCSDHPYPPLPFEYQNDNGELVTVKKIRSCLLRN